MDNTHLMQRLNNIDYDFFTFGDNDSRQEEQILAELEMASVDQLFRGYHNLLHEAEHWSIGSRIDRVVVSLCFERMQIIQRRIEEII